MSETGEPLSNKCMDALEVGNRRYLCMKSKGHEGKHLSHGMDKHYLKAYRIEWAS